MQRFRGTETDGSLKMSMSLASAPSHELGSAPMQPASPIVFVIDDDISVRESLELMIQNEGWRAKTVASAQEFLENPPPGFRVASFLTSFVPVSMVSNCRNELQQTGPRCPSSSSRV